MKYTFKKLLLFIPVILFCFSSCSVTSHTEKAAGVNFSSFQTFTWKTESNTKRPDRADNDIIDNNIKNIVSEELTKKGWREVENNPDVVLDYTIAVKHGTKHETAPVYSSPFSTYIYGRRNIYSIWHPSMLVGVQTRNIPFKEGELSVNMIEAKTNKLIWQGWAQGEINNRSMTTKDISQQVRSIFRKFPS